MYLSTNGLSVSSRSVSGIAGVKAEEFSKENSSNAESNYCSLYDVINNPERVRRAEEWEVQEYYTNLISPSVSTLLSRWPHLTHLAMVGSSETCDIDYNARYPTLRTLVLSAVRIKFEWLEKCLLRFPNLETLEISSLESMVTLTGDDKTFVSHISHITSTIPP